MSQYRDDLKRLRRTLSDQFSIRGKLIAIILFVSLLSLLAAYATISYFQFSNLKKELIRDTQVSAQFISESCVRPLLYSYKEEARSIVSKIGNMPSISQAVILDNEGHLFAVYSRQGGTPDPGTMQYVKEEKILYQGEKLLVFHPVVYHGEQLGSVSILADTDQLSQRIRQYIMFLIFVSLLTGILAFVAAYILQDIISGPILKLAAIAENISPENREDIKANYDKKDEIGTLYRSFNTMMMRIKTQLNERNSAIEALKSGEKKYREIFNSPSDAIIIHDALTTRILEVNQAMLDIYRYDSEEEVIGKFSAEFAPDTTVRGRLLREEFQHTLLTRHDGHLEKEVTRKDGSHFWAELAFRRTIIEDRDHIVVTVRDISNRKLNENELARFQTVIEQSTESILLINPDGVIDYVNPAFYKNTGFERNEILGNRPDIFRETFAEDEIFNDIWHTVRKGKMWSGIVRNRIRDGHLMTYETTISPYFESGGHIAGYMAILHNITESIRLEEQLRQSQKLESLGTLAGGIAHDFNNILTAIIGYNDLALMKVAENLQLDNELQEISMASQRARDLVNQILTFSRKKDKEIVPVKFSHIVGEALQLVRSSIPRTIDIEEIIESKSYILADPVEIHQIVMNLCTNAYQAMKETGGKLVVKLHNFSVSENDPVIGAPVAPGKYVLLDVKDTGPGIPKSIIKNIFDPYFTTKKSGEGTGLGLAVVHGIVNSCKGHISVYSEADKGTLFRVYLPIYDQSPGIKSKTPAAAETTGGTEHILYVDDEDKIVELAQRALPLFGYRVSSFTKSPDALQAFTEDPRAYDLVVTDLTMPEMTGDALTRKMLAIRKDVPIIICTGFSDTLTVEKAKEIGAVEFISKPIVLSDLNRLIRKYLDKKKSE